MNPIEYQRVAIHCDNPQCGYTEQVADINLLKSYINKPCPKCGQVMYTQECFDKSEEVVKLLEILNPLFPFLPQEDKSEDMPQQQTMKINVIFKEGKLQSLEIKNDEIQAVEKGKKSAIKPIPNSQIFETKKKLDERQRKVNFYLEVKEIEPQVSMQEKVDWLIDAHEILSIKN